MKVTRRAPAPDPGARERALARLAANAREHAPDEHLEERDEDVRGGWIPESIRPERLRDARWTLSPRHVVVLAAVLAIGLSWAAWQVFRARPETLPDTRPPTTVTSGSPVTQPGAASSPGSGQPGANPSPGAAQPSTGAGQPSSGAGQPSAAGQGSGTGQSPAGVVVVDVAGKVRRPGLVRAPTGSRVADVLTLAGGPLPGVDLTTLNLARPVTDGEQILVGIPTPPGATTAPGNTPTSPSAAANSPVNLNTADLTQLDTLPGVGPVLAQRILDYRTQNGPFATIDQLQEVPGVGPKKFDSLKSHVRI
ncbi:helix-hairpin-helix domain-containing protein [Kribbella sp. NBC_00889]|uniref:helix-hairpin-helix domain-containing protein n=1 Tax=Kribbella sp. NBC_00889 TaxID=2975974 RepID=UPI003870E0EA|nr:helix-hairpin-helix domain-containing protein [Kribbella sp. NBC_00889]